jgi:hypothetical protein
MYGFLVFNIIAFIVVVSIDTVQKRKKSQSRK